MVILMNSEKVNEQYVLVSENISFKQVFVWAAKALKRKKPKRKLQKWMIAFGWFFQKTGSIFGRKRSITYETINSLHEESFYDNSKIIQEINYQFEPMESVVKRTASNYKN